MWNRQSLQADDVRGEWVPPTCRAHWTCCSTCPWQPPQAWSPYRYIYLSVCPLAPRNLLFLCTSFFVSTELELQALPCFQFYLKYPSSDLLHSFTFFHQGASSWLPYLVFVFQSSLLLQSQNRNSTQLLWNSQFLTLNCLLQLMLSSVPFWFLTNPAAVLWVSSFWLFVQ